MKSQRVAKYIWTSTFQSFAPYKRVVMSWKLETQQHEIIFLAGKADYLRKGKPWWDAKYKFILINIGNERESQGREAILLCCTENNSNSSKSDCEL